MRVSAHTWRLGVVFLLGALMMASTPVQAQDAVKLALKFREGQVLRYTYHEILTYTPPAKFVGVAGYVLEAKVDYSLKVNSVNEEQIAAVRLTFDRITLLKDGNQIADLTVFPKNADSVSATIKPNGETAFYKNFYMTINRSNQLEYRISNGGGVMATNTTSSLGSENFVLAADLDEGQGVIKIGVPPTRTLENPDQARLVEFKVDLTPRKLFEVMTLPSVPLAVGQSFMVPVKFLGQEKLAYQGQADDAGFQGALVQVEVTPWTEVVSGNSGLQPRVTGTTAYLIDSSGKLAKARGRLQTEILVPGIGIQMSDTRLELTLRK